MRDINHAVVRVANGIERCAIGKKENNRAAAAVCLVEINRGLARSKTIRGGAGVSARSEELNLRREGDASFHNRSLPLEDPRRLHGGRQEAGDSAFHPPSTGFLSPYPYL